MLILGLLAGLLMFLSFVCFWLAGDDALSGWTVIGVVLIALLVIELLIWGILLLQLHFDKQNCTKFATNTNRTTKFVRYNYFQWDCLTPTNDGHFIPIDQLRDVSQ